VQVFLKIKQKDEKELISINGNQIHCFDQWQQVS
jgi:hypothetical protein